MKTQYRHTKKVVTLLTNGLDFIPVIGSVKMVVEGIRGEQFGTHKNLKDIPRGIHTIAGFSFLVLDMTSFGTIISEFGKGFLKLGERTLVKSVEEVVTRDAVIHVVEELGIHEIVKKETSLLVEKVEEKLETVESAVVKG
jgi:hypothetical protein